MSAGHVLVTGGAHGIGRAIVERLVETGHRVAFTYNRNKKAADALAAAHPGTTIPFHLDLLNRDHPHEVVSRVESELGAIDGLVNNAGVAGGGILAMTSDERWQEVVEVNLGGVFRMCRAVVPSMVHRKEGAIVNISSLGALRGVAGQGVYSASKAGIVGLTRCLAREIGKRGVRVNAIAPGFVPTEMTASLSEAERSTLTEKECLPGGVDIRCVADTAVFLLSPESRSITGQCIVVDAGASV